MRFQCPTPFLTLAITPLRSASIAIWQALRTAPYRHDRTVIYNEQHIVWLKAAVFTEHTQFCASMEDFEHSISAHLVNEPEQSVFYQPLADMPQTIAPETAEQLRQQAIDFMSAGGALSLHEITSEVDRYITWPGQALSYKVGELSIKALRREAEQTMGEHFDLRAFHDKVLENGSVPIALLEQLVREWVEQHTP